MGGREGGEGVRGGERGEGGEGEGGEGPLPQTAQIHRNFTAEPWGSFMGSHRGTPPPPLPRVGVSGEGIKRWGIEGIRIGTSDRFGRAEANLVAV